MAEINMNARYVSPYWVRLRPHEDGGYACPGHPHHALVEHDGALVCPDLAAFEGALIEVLKRGAQIDGDVTP